MGLCGMRQRLAYADVRQTEVVIHVIQSERLPQPVFALAQRADPSLDRGDMLPDAAVDPLHKGGVDVPAVWRQDVVDGFEGAKHHVVRHVDETPAPHGLHHLRLEQVGQGHPARLGCWTLRLPARWLPPLLIVGEQGCRVRSKSIGQKERRTIGRQHLSDVVDEALRHRQGARADVDGHQQLGHGIDGHSDPVRRARQALDRLGLTALPILDGTEYGIQLIALLLLDVDLTEAGYNGFCGSCSTPFSEPEISKFSSQLSA
jgi:hypothetical protein